MNEKKEKNIKKQNRIRLWFQVAWFVLTNGYIRGYTKGKIFNGNTKVFCVPGLNCYSCPGALAACPMGALQAVLGNTSYRMSLYVFGMLAAMGVVFGRLICGWMCPFGLFQDLMYKIKVKTKRKNLPGHKYLKYLRYVILVVFPILLVSVMLDVTGASMPWFCEWICPSGMLLGGIPLVTVNSGLRSAIGARFIWKLAILLAITILSVFYYRPFCKYLCPLGAIYGIFNPISSYRLVIDQDKCVKCGTCQKACGMDIKTFETANSPDCIRCGCCMAACPTGAIESTWGRFGQKVKKRCFIDDGDLLPAHDADEAAALIESIKAGKTEIKEVRRNGRPIFLGILMLIAGFSTLCLQVMQAVYSTFSSHYIIEQYRSMNVGVAIAGVIWCIMSVIVFLTGVYAIRFNNDPERLFSINEKLKIAWKISGIGWLVGLIAAILAPANLGSLLTMMITDVYLIIGVPFLMIQVSLMCRDIRNEKKSTILWCILSVINTLIAFSSPWLALIIMNNAG